MTLKQILKIGSALLFLYAVFGYLFPFWGLSEFSHNENLWHLVLAIVLNIAAELPKRWQLWLIAVISLKFLALGLYGFGHTLPADITIRSWHISAHLDTFDNYSNTLLGLVFTWLYVTRRNKS